MVPAHIDILIDYFEVLIKYFTFECLQIVWCLKAKETNDFLGTLQVFFTRIVVKGSRIYTS
jgi:hypothetical protein